jgi:hypothetical protein
MNTIAKIQSYLLAKKPGRSARATSGAGVLSRRERKGFLCFVA